MPLTESGPKQAGALPVPARPCRSRGFTLLEAMIAVVILATLTAIAVPAYQGYIERTRRAQAVRDIGMFEMAIERFRTLNGTFPGSLAQLGAGLPGTDPWGNAYGYLAIDVLPPPPNGAVRRDRNLNPLNSDYDLYSTGPDGRTQTQITGARARDNIIRAGNGGYIGLASEH